MSYLTLTDNIGSVSQAVISFWFRVPQESMDKALAAYQEAPKFPGPILDGVIPLVVMGQSGKYKAPEDGGEVVDAFTIYTWVTSTGGAGGYEVIEFVPGTNPRQEVSANTTAGEEQDTDPTVIGVSCGSNAAPPAQLYVNLQTGVKPQIEGAALERAITPGTQHNIPSHLGTSSLVPEVDNWKNISKLVYNESVNFVGGTGVLDDEGEPTLIVEPDQWHHVLISFEIKPCNARGYNGDKQNRLPSEDVQSTSKLWIALDDVNYTKFELSEELEWGGNPNEVLTEDAFAVIGKGSADLTTLDTEILKNTGATNILPDFSAACSSIDITEIGLPAPTGYKDNVLRVEMAEFQLFTGVTLDTGIEENRRAFVDNDGKPVAPNKSSEDGPPGSIDLFGQRPDILLRGSSKWKNGKNTGSTGTDDAGEEIPTGQFEPTALIATYKPNPSLHGPQNPGET